MTAKTFKKIRANDNDGGTNPVHMMAPTTDGASNNDPYKTRCGQSWHRGIRSTHDDWDAVTCGDCIFDTAIQKP